MLKLEYTNIVCKSNNKNSISSSNGYQLQGRKGSDQTHSTLQLGGRNGSGTCAGGDWHSCRGSGFGHFKCLSLLQTLPTGLEWGLCNRCRAVPAECWPNPPQCWGFRPKSEGDPRLAEPMTCRKIHNIANEFKRKPFYIKFNGNWWWTLTSDSFSRATLSAHWAVVHLGSSLRACRPLAPSWSW